MRPTLPLVLLIATAFPLMAQLPADGRTSYARDDRIKIPFELRNARDATKIVLYYAIDGGAWQEYESLRPNQKREFIFKADREASYAFATMTYFADGSTDPSRKDQLLEQKRVVVDKTAPKVQSLRPSVSPNGDPGVEWDITDENMDPKGIRLEFKWPEMQRFEQIDRSVPFTARDSRHWTMKQSDRMQVRIIATDRAGNRATSDPIYVSGKDAERSGEATPRTATGASNARETDVTPASGSRAVQPALHYINTKSVNLKVDATVGPSGLLKSFLYAADEKLVWKMAKENGPQPAPETTTPEKSLKVPVGFQYEAEKDGLYNFIFIVEAHTGTNRRMPKTGEQGQLQIMVDTMKPIVEIISTKVSPNGDRGAIVDIRWKATDANIAPVPIKLEYQAIRRGRPGEQGDWKALTPDWIDNTGQHTWSAPTGEAHEFLIRVTAKDRAGNESSVQTVKPVNTDLTVPGVDNVDVAPGQRGAGAGAGASTGPAPGLSNFDVSPASSLPPRKGP